MRVNGIDVFYGDLQVLWDVSFEVRPGEIVVLVGANGAGKSTVIKTVSALIKPRKGSVEFDGVRIDQVGAAFEDVDAGNLQEAPVDAVEALNFSVFVGDQRGPVESPFANGPTKTSGVLEVIPEACSIDQQLLGDAADVDAGAAQVTLLGYGDFGAVARCDATGSDTAGAASDHE